MKRANHRGARSRRIGMPEFHSSSRSAGYTGAHCATKERLDRSGTIRALSLAGRPAALAASLLCVACATVAFSCSFPIENRAETEQTPISAREKAGRDDGRAAQSQGEKIVAEPQAASSAGASGNQAQGGGDAAGLMVDALDGFAVWARGRLAVSSGGADDELVLEVDPDAGRLRAWVDAAIDGRLEVAGDVRARSFGTAGEVAGGTVSAGVVNAAEGSLERLGVSELKAIAASIGNLAGERIQAMEAAFEHATADRLASNEVEASTVRASEDLEASNAELGKAEIASATVGVGSFGTLQSDGASFGTMMSEALSAVEASITHIGSESAVVSEVRSGIVASSAVSAKSIETESLSSGRIDVQTLVSAAADITLASVGTLTAQGVQAATLQAERVEAGEGSFAGLRVGGIDTDRLGSGESPVDALFARLGTVTSLAAETVSADSIDAGEVHVEFIGTEESPVEELFARVGTMVHLAVERLEVDEVQAGELKAESLRAGAIDADSATVSSMDTDSLKADSAEFGSIAAEAVNARSVSSDSLSGTIEGFSVDGASAGVAVFASIEADGSGADATCVVETSLDADALIVTPTASDCPYLCSWEVREIEPGSWEISRRFGHDALESMSMGEFPAQPEIAVYWLAVDYE